MHKRTPTRRSRSCAPCVVRVQDITCTWQVHDKYLLKGGRGGLIHVVATAGLSSHHPFLKPLGAESEDAPPGDWVYYMTSCFLSMAERCSPDRPPPQSGVSSQSVPAATTICHFPPPQRLEIVLCPVASPLTQTHAPLWPPAPLSGMDSNKKALFFPKDKNAENLPSSLSASTPERAGSLHGTEQGWDQLSVLLGTQLRVRQVPILQMRTLRFRGRKGLHSEDWGSGEGSQQPLLEPTKSNPRGGPFSSLLLFPPLWCNPSGSLAFLEHTRQAAAASGPLHLPYFLPGTPFPHRCLLVHFLQVFA